MKATRFLKRLLGYSLLAVAFFGWLTGMLIQSGSPLGVQQIFVALLLVVSVLGLFAGFIRLLIWCFTEGAPND